MYPNIGPISTYNVMLFLAFVSAFLVFELYFRKKLGLKGRIMNLEEANVLLCFCFGLLFAYLLQNLYNFIRSPSSYHWEWTLTFYGGLLGGAGWYLLGYALFLKKNDPSLLKKTAQIAPACITLAHGFGRIGCFLNGCCYGVRTDAFYGVRFPGMDYSVVPTNLFEAIYLFLLAGLFLYLAFGKESDLSMPLYLILYPLWRFFIEFARGDDVERGSFVPGLSPSQFWSILFFLGGVVSLILVLRNRKKRKGAAKEAPVRD